jgi:hypothetical protein
LIACQSLLPLKRQIINPSPITEVIRYDKQVNLRRSGVYRVVNIIQLLFQKCFITLALRKQVDAFLGKDTVGGKKANKRHSNGRDKEGFHQS